jgi:hypothetical protein
MTPEEVAASYDDAEDDAPDSGIGDSGAGDGGEL